MGNFSIEVCYRIIQEELDSKVNVNQNINPRIKINHITIERRKQYRIKVSGKAQM